MRVQDWGNASALFQKAIAQWKSLGKNLILIAHQYNNTDDDGALIAQEPLFIGQLRSKVPAMVDECWYAKAILGTKGIRVVFRTTPDGKRESMKSRSGCLDAEEPADFYAIRRKIASFYDVPEADIWKTYHGTEGRARAKQEAAEQATLI